MRANECSSSLESSVMETGVFIPTLLARVVSERGETLPEPGQVAQKQMRSDTGAKECFSPEPRRVQHC